jgi:hypothetical protein
VKKIFAGLMSLAMVLGLAFGGGSSADASTGSGTWNVTSEFGVASPEVTVSLLSDGYVWGYSTYVQQRITVPAGFPDYSYDVIMQPQRNLSGVWTNVEGSQQTFHANSGDNFIANSLIAANGIYKAKGNYRIQYTFVQYHNDQMTFDYGNSKTFNIN